MSRTNDKIMKCTLYIEEIFNIIVTYFILGYDTEIIAIMLKYQ